MIERVIDCDTYHEIGVGELLPVVSRYADCALRWDVKLVSENKTDSP